MANDIRETRVNDPLWYKEYEKVPLTKVHVFNHMLCFLEILGDILDLFTIEAQVPFFTLAAELNQSGSS